MIPHSKPDIGDAEIAAVSGVLRSGQLAQGAEVAAFEEACAEFTGRRHAVAVSSGTAALHLALLARGVNAGDAVAIPSYACAALVQPIVWQRAEPVLCDVTEAYQLDPAEVPGACRAVVQPHLFGAPAPAVDGDHVIEDLAQSFGGETGRATPVAIASFYATKMLTTGEGGMVLTDDPDIAALARDRRDYDNRDGFEVRYSYKMTEFQAALGRVQLRRLPEFVARRRELAARYGAAFDGLPLRLPDADGHVFFRYVVASESRAALEAHCRARGVEAKRPVHRPAHHLLGGTYPRSEAAHAQCLSLPLYPAMTDAEAAAVIESVLSFFG